MMGDDSPVATRFPVSLDSFAKFTSKCGMIVDVEKTQVSSNLNTFKFLGYYINHEKPKKPVEEL